jgi:hypothetical protein
MHLTDTATPQKPQLVSFCGPRCVRDGVRGRVRLKAVLAVMSLTLAAACGRTELNPFGTQTASIKDGGPRDVPADLPRDVPPDLPVDLPIDLPPDAPPDLNPDVPIERPPVCVPVAESCNGRDDDCDGMVDEDQPPIPCANGGNRYCVAGSYSECPRRCDVCIPRSTRVCQTSFCNFWGTQECTSDGRSFGPCSEQTALPSECKAIAEKNRRSKELEQCCVENGYCCRDEFDLDGDGDYGDMVGNCGAVACE